MELAHMLVVNMEYPGCSRMKVPWLIVLGVLLLVIGSQ